MAHQHKDIASSYDVESPSA